MELVKGILTAMPQEAELIIQKYALKEVKKLKNIVIYEGEKEWEDGTEKIVLAVSWIGKTQSAIATTYLFENYDIFKLVNIWIAWCVRNTDAKVGDVFLPNTFTAHDAYLPFDGAHLDYFKKPIFLEYAIGEDYDLQKFGLILNGICVTGDQFIDSSEKVSELRDVYWADVVEMEAFSVLSVAREYDALDKCIVIKAISDLADGSASVDQENNLAIAMENSINILDFLL